MSKLFRWSISLGFVMLPLALAQTAEPQPYKVELTQPVTTEGNQKGDKVVARVLLPETNKGDILEGEVKESKSSGSLTKESVLNFGFSKLFHEGKEIPIRAEISKFYNSKGKENVDEEGRIISRKNDLGKAAMIGGLGAGIGAIADKDNRGRGAAIGGGAGAAVGLLFARFGTKAPQISFAAGSVFEVMLSTRRQ